MISPIDKNGDNIHRCKQASGTEEVVQPFRCLYMSSKREEINLPSTDCSVNSIIGSGECLRPEKWQQLASIECANKSLNLNNSIMTLDWCGLSSFRGIEFVCCPSKKLSDNDYETSLDEQDENNLMEDDPVSEIPPAAHHRIIAMTLASRKLRENAKEKHLFLCVQVNPIGWKITDDGVQILPILLVIPLGFFSHHLIGDI